MSWTKSIGNFPKNAYSFGKKHINTLSGMAQKASNFLNSKNGTALIKGFDTIAELTGYGKNTLGKYKDRANNFINRGQGFLKNTNSVLDNVKGVFKQRKEDSMERRKPRKEADYMADLNKITDKKYNDRSNNSHDNSGRGMFRLFET